MYRKLDVFEKYYSKMCKKQWKIDNGKSTMDNKPDVFTHFDVFPKKD